MKSLREASVLLVTVSLLIVLVNSQDSTDSIRDADELQSGYLPNHKLDPVVVGSSFELLWRVFTGGSVPGLGIAEQFLAKPLIYTPSGHPQVVIVASETNWVYVLDAITGAILKKRQVRSPFNGTDLPCTDTKGTIGITGTPIIKPSSNTLYFFAKGYKGAAGGVFNGAYFLYAVDALALSDRAGYPVLIDGNPADNAPEKYFHGGTHLQRTSLSIMADTVYAAFGGVCEKYNFTGYIVGVDTETPKIKTIFTTISGPDSIPQNGTWEGGGGEAGIWQSGRSFASDGAGRFFVAAGNGKLLGSYATPRPGSTPPKILEGAIINLRVDQSTGKLTPQDFFRPYDYAETPADVRDISSGGVTILDPSSFTTGTASKLGLVGGKNGKMYLINMNNMGGFKNGNLGTDAVVQTILMPPTGSQSGPPFGAIFGTIASYPLPELQGGYIYVKPTTISGDKLMLSKIYVYKFHRENGTITEVARSDDSTPSNIGTGIPTVTSFDGSSGTGIVWVTTRDGDLNAYRAIPTNGLLQRIPLPTGIKGAKFQRPAFGNGRVYVSTSSGHIACYGKP